MCPVVKSRPLASTDCACLQGVGRLVVSDYGRGGFRTLFRPSKDNDRRDGRQDSAEVAFEVAGFVDALEVNAKEAIYLLLTDEIL